MPWLDFLQLILFIGSAIFVSLLIGLFIIQKSVTSPFPIIKRNKKELSFFDPNENRHINFPSIDDEEPSKELSVIIPAYNEEERLPKMLEECMMFLEEKAQSGSFTYEVIVVSDGSTDKTIDVALEYSKKYTCDQFRLLNLIENRGKGGAVRLGMLSARGKFLLFADADGATKFPDYDKLAAAMLKITSNWNRNAVVVGSRAHLEKEAIASRSLFRTVLMYGFHLLVWFFAVKKIRDTQCGFKLLSRSAAQTLFKIMHVERWAFDVELLYIAQRLKMPIVEVGVNWTEIEGSKLTPFWSWLQMGTDLFLIWFRYTVGAWKVKKEHQS